jgi:hypothetical protein
MRSKPLPLVKRGFALALALALCGPASADPRVNAAPGVDIEVGLFCPPETAGQREAPGTVFGWVHIPAEPIEIRVPGELTVPAVLGLGFGVRFHVPKPMALTYRITHPPMAPDGTTVQSWTGHVDPGTVEGVYFQFDIEAELLPGPWTITALAREEPIFRAEFTVLPPADAPEHAGLCAGGLLLTAL